MEVLNEIASKLNDIDCTISNCSTEEVRVDTMYDINFSEMNVNLKRIADALEKMADSK